MVDNDPDKPVVKPAEDARSGEIRHKASSRIWWMGIVTLVVPMIILGAGFLGLL